MCQFSRPFTRSVGGVKINVLINKIGVHHKRRELQSVYMRCFMFIGTNLKFPSLI